MIATTKDTRDGFTWVNPKDIVVWKNPRTERNAGFSLDEMTRLQEDIRINGLKLPLEIRSLKEVWNLIAGERRLRSILDLIADNKLCFNRITRKMEPASQVYAKVCCVETTCADDREAMIAAVMENFLHAPLTEYEILLQCQLLEDAGLSRKDQAERLGKSEAWISQTFSLLDPEKCHPKVLEAMADDILGRTQALQFLTYAPEKVEAILTRAIERHKYAQEAKEQEAIEAIDAAVKAWEEQEEALRQAEEADDAKAVAVARKKLHEAEVEQAEAEEKVKKAKKGGKKKPKPSIQDIQDAAKDEEVDGTAQRHVPIKQVRQIADKLTELIDSEEELVNTLTEKPYDRREVKIIRDVLDFVLSRNKMRTPMEALN